MVAENSIKTITLATIFEFSQRQGGKNVYEAWANMMREQGREIDVDKGRGWDELPDADRELDVFISARIIARFLSYIAEDTGTNTPTFIYHK